MSNDQGVFTLGHSPDPDDAFMFYAMAENKINMRGYRFEHRLEDIQTLNERALRGELHISAISIHAYPYVSKRYALLPCGASMGNGYGPILIRNRRTSKIESAYALPRRGMHRISKEDQAFDESAARDFLLGRRIAVPGKMTSAFLALQLFLGEFDFVVVPFDQIFDAVKTGGAEAGLIIHEGQLTYARSGFQKVIDLGEWWKRATGLPLPLGGNVLRKDIPKAAQHDLLEIVRESIEFALAHQDEAVHHSLPYARDMDAKLAGKFIGMYVNEFARDYGEIGRAAIRRFLGEARDKGYIDAPIKVEFVE